MGDNDKLEVGERVHVDYATVRKALETAQERRGEELSFDQRMALNHAMWAASDLRNGIKTDTKIFNTLLADLLEVDKLAAAPDIAAKIAEILPIDAGAVRAIIATKRLAMDDDEVEHVVDIVRKQVL